MVHSSKKDWWLAGLLGLVIAVELVAGAALMGIALVSGPWQVLIPASILLLVGGLLLWILVGTSYEITETSLVIRLGPFRWTIPLDAIEDVVPQRHWYGGPLIEWNFGLSVQGERRPELAHPHLAARPGGVPSGVDGAASGVGRQGRRLPAAAHGRRVIG
jgi:Bacterial PH domain